MPEFQPNVAEIPVHYVSLGADLEELPDRKVHALCFSVPRVGETVIPPQGTRKIVHDVYHELVKNEGAETGHFPYLSMTTVVLRDHPEEAS